MQPLCIEVLDKYFVCFVYLSRIIGMYYVWVNFIIKLKNKEKGEKITSSVRYPFLYSSIALALKKDIPGKMQQGVQGTF